MVLLKQVQAIVLAVALTTSAVAAQNSAPPQDLKQLVAPIALYPDALLAQVLAASTYPTEVVDAERWLRQNMNLTGEQLAAQVDKQPWDPSIKGLAQFPSVLENMSKNLSWTSSLGDAYFNDPNGVMSAVQELRRDAENAGNLNSSSQQTVTTEGQTIVIQPANPEVVYVPTYSPSAVYGTPIAAYPGYSGWDVAAASAISFGAGIAVGALSGGWGWGWGHWGTNWHGGSVTFNRNNYVSRSNTFVNRNSAYRNSNVANVNRNVAKGQVNRGNYSARNFGANNLASRPAVSANRNFAGTQANRASVNRQRQSAAASRGFGDAGRSSVGARNGAFGGFSQGGAARVDGARGRASFGGGGRSGGGGFRGGGRGGRR